MPTYQTVDIMSVSLLLHIITQIPDWPTH